MTLINSHVSVDERCMSTPRSLNDAVAALEAENTVAWIGLRDSDPGTLADAAHRFGLRPLAVEDAQKGHQRAKLDGTRHPARQTPIDGLRATPPAALPFLANAQVRSFILERRQGNVTIYNFPGLSKAAAEICALGKATQLMINHGHEAMYGPPRLDVPVFVHERDRPETASGLPVADTFTDRQMIDDDLEVIPTPGHTPGTTGYLWDSGSHRFLFTGDSLSVQHGDRKTEAPWV